MAPGTGLSVSMQHGVHPSCRPAAREAVADPGGVREGDALPLPTFDEIQAGRTPTLRHVPGRARWLWAMALTRAFAAVVHFNDERSWRELYMLPAYTLDRLKRWEDGERIQLWHTRRQLQRLGG